MEQPKYEIGDYVYAIFATMANSVCEIRKCIVVGVHSHTIKLEKTHYSYDLQDENYQYNEYEIYEGYIYPTKEDIIKDLP